MTPANPSVLDERLANLIFKIKCTLSTGDKIEVDARAQLAIDYENVLGELMSCVTVYSEWANLYAEAKFVFDSVDSAVEARRGVILNELLDSFSEGEKKVKLTDKILTHMINADEQLTKLIHKRNLANRAVIKLYHTTKALEHKIEVCRSIAGFKKKAQEIV